MWSSLLKVNTEVLGVPRRDEVSTVHRLGGGWNGRGPTGLVLLFYFLLSIVEEEELESEFAVVVSTVRNGISVALRAITKERVRHILHELAHAVRHDSDCRGCSHRRSMAVIGCFKTLSTVLSLRLCRDLHIRADSKNLCGILFFLCVVKVVAVMVMVIRLQDQA